MGAKPKSIAAGKPTGRTGKALSLRSPKKAPKLGWRETAQSYALDEWYGSEDAKRSLGSICRAVSVQGRSVALLGTGVRPLAVLSPASSKAPSQLEVLLNIDEVKADWSAVTSACLLFGTAFRISGSHHTHAILSRHAMHRHHALRYRRPQLEDIPQNLTLLLDDLREIGTRFDVTTKLIDRRFKEVWRDKNV